MNTFFVDKIFPVEAKTGRPVRHDQRIDILVFKLPGRLSRGACYRLTGAAYHAGYDPFRIKRSDVQ